MKQIILVRHAKSDWDNSIPNDIDRPISDEGRYEAHLMAKRLLKKHIPVDAFISSPAKRAITTAAYFAEAYQAKEKEIIKMPELYHAYSFDFFEVINKLDNAINNVVLISHNPGITDFANRLTETRIDHMPTCSVFAVQALTDNWKDFQKQEKKFLFFEYPKMKENNN
jgi:phosphohistidine phosphatase